MDTITVLEHVSYDRDTPDRGDFLIIQGPDKTLRCHITETVVGSWLVEHLSDDCTILHTTERASTIWHAIDLARALLNITT